jgi:hypothetical protein
MLLHLVLLCLLPTTYVTARSSIITIIETSCFLDFRANFRLSTSQTSTAQSSIASNDLILEWEELLPEFTGYLSYNGSLMCTPTAEPSITLPTVMSDSNGAEVPLTEFPWSWSCVPDSCATVTSLGSQNQLVVNYGSGGPHWNFTALSSVVEDGLFTYANSSTCTTTTDFMTLYLPATSTILPGTSLTASALATSTIFPGTSSTASAQASHTCNAQTCPFTSFACPNGTCACGLDANHQSICFINHDCKNTIDCTANTDCDTSYQACLIGNCCSDDIGHCANLTGGCQDSPITSVPAIRPSYRPGCKRVNGC